MIFLEDNSKGGKDFEETEETVGELSEETREEKEIKEEEKTVMDTAKDSDDTFVTYHIHIVGESDTKETICKKYNISYNTLEEYNSSINELNIGDKVLIPEIDE